ncbi:hypothetical protein F5Y11DRAFT_346936 [Daldinia sp. FL1419]|nr:hypothetical protein F5Y11DRAFT_346936 [Daldinia sp. FL1419]
MPSQDPTAYVEFLQHRQELWCSVLGCQLAFLNIDSDIRDHLQSYHPSLIEGDNLPHLVDMLREGIPMYYVAIFNYNGLLLYGQDDSVLLKVIRHSKEIIESDAGVAGSTPSSKYELSQTEEGALKLFKATCDIVLRRLGDFNTLPFLHAVLVFIFHLTHYPDALVLIEKAIPWKLISLQLNSLLLYYCDHNRIYSNQFPQED